MQLNRGVTGCRKVRGRACEDTWGWFDRDKVATRVENTYLAKFKNKAVQLHGTTFLEIGTEETELFPY
jgi:hypothetical protein